MSVQAAEPGGLSDTSGVSCNTRLLGRLYLQMHMLHILEH